MWRQRWRRQTPRACSRRPSVPTSRSSSGKLAIALQFDAKGLAGLNGPLAIKLTGPFESQGKGKLPKFDLRLTLNTGDSDFTAGAVSTGTKGFLKVQKETYVVSDRALQAVPRRLRAGAPPSPTEKSDSLSFRGLGIDPLRWLKDPENDGTESVGGADSFHVTAGLDVAQASSTTSTGCCPRPARWASRADLPSSLTDQQRQDIQRSVKSAKLDVWTGKDDKTLRRLRIDIDISVPGEVQKRAGGLKDGKLDFELTIADLNRPQTIKTPTNARPLADLTAALTRAERLRDAAEHPHRLGTAHGAGGTGRRRSSTSTACRRPAATSSKVQKCAELLRRLALAPVSRFLRSSTGWPYLLVPFIPIAIVLEVAHASASVIFFASALGDHPDRCPDGPRHRGARARARARASAAC